MSSSYNGSSAGITPRQATTITIPSDGDALTAASNNTPDQSLANLVAFLMERAVLLGNAGSAYNNTPPTGNSIAIKGTGIGSGSAGGDFTGGTNANGVNGTGAGTGAGVSGTGGATSGVGVFGTGGGANGIGVKGQGSGGLYGVQGIGGASGGTGIRADGGGTNGNAIEAYPVGIGIGVYAESIGSAAIIAKRGSAVTDSLSETMQLANGHLKFGGTNPAYNAVVQANALHPGLIIKAWGQFTWTNAAPVLSTFGANMSSINSPSAGNVDLTFVTAINSGVLIIPVASTGFTARVSSAFANRIVIQDTTAPTPANVTFTATTGMCNFLVLGLQ